MINLAYFFERTVMVHTYLWMLNIIIPRLNYLFENENEILHYHANMRKFLNQALNQRRIVRREIDKDLLLLSTNLTPLDFYL